MSRLALPLALVLVLGISLWASAQTSDQVAAQSKVIALENAWNQAEERKDAKALDEILDQGLVYTDYDGTMMTKADFLTSVKAPSRHPEQQITESMNAHVYGNVAVVTGVYRVRGRRTERPISAEGASPIPGSAAAAHGSVSPASSP